MIAPELLQTLRFLTAPALAILQFWVLWGVCNSYTILIARVIQSELSITDVLSDLARATALTGLFLLLAGMVWSWAAKIEGYPAVTWFVVFAATATLSPLLVGDRLGGPSVSLGLGLPIRLVLMVAVSAALLLGSNMFRTVRSRIAAA